MKCHYITDRDGNRVLIPGCMGMAVYNDKSYCTCKRSGKTTEQRLYELESKVKKMESKQEQQ